MGIVGGNGSRSQWDFPMLATKQQGKKTWVMLTLRKEHKYATW